MCYTNEEVKKILENMKKIRAWLENIAVKIGTNFSVGFSDGVYDYSLAVSCNGCGGYVSGCIGNLSINWYEVDKFTSGECGLKNRIGYCVAVIENWYKIKMRFYEEEIRQEHLRDTINNFEI